MLKEHLNWPGGNQVFRVERLFERILDGKIFDELSHGVTSLTRQEAEADRLLAIVRARWGIENKLHVRRDDTLKEDRYRLKGQGAQAMATITSLVLGLLRNSGFVTLPDARRCYAAHSPAAVALILRSPA